MPSHSLRVLIVELALRVWPKASAGRPQGGRLGWIGEQGIKLAIEVFRFRLREDLVCAVLTVDIAGHTCLLSDASCSTACLHECHGLPLDLADKEVDVRTPARNPREYRNLVKDCATPYTAHVFTTFNTMHRAILRTLI